MDTVVSGMRPTGALHLGHYVGTIKNWVDLQGQVDCYYFLADWHALTAYYDDLKRIQQSRMEYIRGWVASGVDPDKTVIYNQSDIPQVLYLNQYFQVLTPPGWADRSPSWKDLKENPDKKLDNIGFFCYPILQAADVAIMGGNLVPVGEDQVSHIELSREIVRKFNRLYGDILPEPNAKLTKVPRLPGLDGRKMSSSLGNSISLQDTPKAIQKKVNKIKTDDKRGGIENPGDPSNCSVFTFQEIFQKAEKTAEIVDGCTKAQLSCGECKKFLGDSLKELLNPISERMNKITDDDCMDIIAKGNLKAQKKAETIWQSIKNKTGF